MLFNLYKKRAKQIVDLLIAGNELLLHPTWNDKKFRLYDNTLLDVLQKRKMNGDEIFASIFSRNPVQRVLRFLDNESSLGEDLQIMRSVPMSVFLPAALREMCS